MNSTPLLSAVAATSTAFEPTVTTTQSAIGMLLGAGLVGVMALLGKALNKHHRTRFWWPVCLCAAFSIGASTAYFGFWWFSTSFVYLILGLIFWVGLSKHGLRWGYLATVTGWLAGLLLVIAINGPAPGAGGVA